MRNLVFLKKDKVIRLMDEQSQCFHVVMPLWRQASAPCRLLDGDPAVTSGQTHLLSPTHQHRPYLVAFLRYPRRSARNQQTITASELICVGHRQSLAEIFTKSHEKISSWEWNEVLFMERGRLWNAEKINRVHALLSYNSNAFYIPSYLSRKLE